mgnify:CR=1 FL=1
MTEYETLLDKMHFIIGSTLMDNNIGRQGIGNIEPVAETEILRSNRRTYMELRIMMLRLERALYGEKNYEEDDTEVSNRDTRPSNDTESRKTSSRSSRVGNFSC